MILLFLSVLFAHITSSDIYHDLTDRPNFRPLPPQVVPPNGTKTLHAVVIQLLDMNSARAIFFGQNLLPGTYCIKAFSFDDHERQITVNFTDPRTSPFASDPFRLTEQNLLLGEELVVKSVTLLNPTPVQLSFIHHKRTNHLRICIPSDTESPLVSSADIVLSSDQTSFIIEIIGVNLADVTSFWLESSSPSLSVKVQRNMNVKNSSFRVLSEAIDSSGEPNSFIQFGHEYVALFCRTSNGAITTYAHTIVAPHEDPLTTFVISELQSFLVDSSHAVLAMNGTNLPSGEYEFVGKSSGYQGPDLSMRFRFSSTVGRFHISDPFSIGPHYPLQMGDTFLPHSVRFLESKGIISIFRDRRTVFGSVFEIPQSIQVPKITTVMFSFADDTELDVFLHVYGESFLPGHFTATFLCNDVKFEVELFPTDISFKELKSTKIPISTESSHANLSYSAKCTNFVLSPTSNRQRIFSPPFYTPDPPPIAIISSIEARLVHDCCFSLLLSGNNLQAGLYTFEFVSQSLSQKSQTLQAQKESDGKYLITSAISIDHTSFSFQTRFDVGSVTFKSNTVQFENAKSFSVTIPAKPSQVVDSECYLMLSGKNADGCGFSKDNACLNLLTAINNQLIRAQQFLQTSPLTVIVLDGGFASPSTIQPIIFDVIVTNALKTTRHPIITVEDQTQILVISAFNSQGSLSFRSVDFSIDCVEKDNPPFIFVVEARFEVSNSRITNGKHSVSPTFLKVSNGDILITGVKFVEIGFSFPILDFQIQPNRTFSLSDASFSVCGSYSTNALISGCTDTSSFKHVLFETCKSQRGSLCLSAIGGECECAECEWAGCSGLSGPAALSISINSGGQVTLLHCSFTACQTSNEWNPSSIFVTQQEQSILTCDGLTFASTIAITEPPHVKINHPPTLKLDLNNLCFDFWTTPSLFIHSTDGFIFQPLASLPGLQQAAPVVNIFTTTDPLVGRDTPLCGGISRPCGSIGVALTHATPSADGHVQIVVHKAGYADVGTSLVDTHLTGEFLSTQLIVRAFSGHSEDQPSFSTKNAEIGLLTLDYTHSPSTAVIEHVSLSLLVHSVRFSTTLSTSPCLVRVIGGTATLNSVKIDPTIFVQPAFALFAAESHNVIQCQVDDVILNSPLIFSGSLDPASTILNLSAISARNITFGGGNSALFDIRQTQIHLANSFLSGTSILKSNHPTTSNHTNISLFSPQTTGVILLHSCNTVFSNVFIRDFSEGAIFVKSGILRLYRVSFDRNGITSSNRSARKNVAVIHHGMLSIKDVMTEQHVGGLWITLDETSSIVDSLPETGPIDQQPSNSTHNFDGVLTFRPHIDKIRVSSSQITIYGHSLFPCLSITVYPVSSDDILSDGIPCTNQESQDGTRLTCSFNSTRILRRPSNGVCLLSVLRTSKRSTDQLFEAASLYRS
ncbi:hypothetical protein BLNAU_6759 [Blattamonas nauphoetae]|uniref:Uncharacterized protein n=1 Tax=Blattamonas nauphoetae TaxID=2049346 RepID=A0ABQ9Y3F8_9EUKA|nr:hypothetical protein BLNAU_6759 [Blattamonas nauphoetae]